jgi:glycine dehydrogenase subunit 1
LVQAGLTLPFKQSTFNEFVVQFPKGFNRTYEALQKKRIVAGLPLECYYPELSNHYLLCATETISKEDMDELVSEVR